MVTTKPKSTVDTQRLKNEHTTIKNHQFVFLMQKQKEKETIEIQNDKTQLIG